MLPEMIFSGLAWSSGIGKFAMAIAPVRLWSLNHGNIVVLWLPFCFVSDQGVEKLRKEPVDECIGIPKDTSVEATL